MNTKLIKVLNILGIVAIILGAVDPLEGSVVILAGSGLISLSAWVNKDRQLKLFLISFLMIVTGVISLFSLSALGGFGGRSSLSWWWGLLIVPYPLGWLLSVALLINKAYRKRSGKQTVA